MAGRMVADIVRGRELVTLQSNATVKEACRQMCDRRVGAVLVVDAPHHLVGIFTGRDAVYRILAEGRDPSKTTLAEVMTQKPHTMSPQKSAIDALRQMHDGGYRHIPVVDNGALVGVVSRNDFRGLEKARIEDEVDIWERI
ncbi:MAG: cyclic nucleotide-binding/CBS domain-containing protein [Alphaproteobacteria bacterium]